MNKVFISYGSQDRQLVDRLCAWLESRGIPCWMAPRDIASGLFAGEITRAIKATDVMIVICSKHSLQSEHVKSEINLAFNGAKLILPYCLDDSPFDDDMEYYLSSWQRIVATSDQSRDFDLIERYIRNFRQERPAIVYKTEAPKRRARWPFQLLVLLGLLAGSFLWIMSRKAGQETNPPNDSVSPGPDSSQVEIVPQQEAYKVRTEAKKDNQLIKNPQTDTFSGIIIDGHPDGTGTYTFKHRRRIDMHDPEERYAEAGDFIKGNWNRGHLNYGTWFGADSIQKGFIRIGDCPNIELDHQLGKCVKP